MTDPTRLNEALAANYLLVDLQIRSWSGKRMDRTASTQVLTANNATSDGGSFVKNLLASAGAELKNVHTLGNGLRSFVYGSTLPWSSNTSADGARRGERLVASAKAMQFLRDLNSLKKEYDRAVGALETAWPNRVAQAMQNLGTLADPGDYPSAHQLRGMFSVNVDLRPIPSVADFSRLNVPGELAEALGDRHAEQAEIQVANAMNDMKERLVEELGRMATQLGKHAKGEKTRLYDSLVTNMQGIVQLARNMNLTSNPRLTALVDRIEHDLLSKPISMYKDDIKASGVTADAAAAFAVEAAEAEIWS